VRPNATDCHHHVHDARFPLSPSATLRPPDASIEDHRQLQRRLGLTRNIVVQPSTYGTDNRLVVESVSTFGPTARGLAMLDATVTSAEIKRLHEAGIRGVRFGTRLPGGRPWTTWCRSLERLRTSAGTSSSYPNAIKIVELGDVLKSLPVPVASSSPRRDTGLTHPERRRPLIQIVALQCASGGLIWTARPRRRGPE
jgi:Amidohydrolase